ncbi:MAG: serine hydrolase domain-containing protein [Longimicrobiales bacterium]
MNVRIALLALLLPLSGVRPLVAQPGLEARVDSLFERWDAAESPGCALGVVQDGRMAYERGYGFANLDDSLPNGPGMVYYVGSVSKQFTAASIALLAQEGRISIDDDVRNYVPELPDYGRTMSIRHLVHHTSRLRDYYTLMSLAGIRSEDVLTDDDLLALITRQKELNFLPGDEYLYSNSGYWLLGQIVERVTGQSLREYARTRIFEPLRMRDTHFHDEPWHPMVNRAVSYEREAGSQPRIAYLANFDKIGAGGLYTTLDDLRRWDANFYEPRVGGDEFLRTLHTRGILTNGDTLPYAFGLMIGEYRGLRTVRHSGGLMGFRAELARFPGEHFAVIVQCNQADINATALANGVADLYLADRLDEPAARGGDAEPDRDAAESPAWQPTADALRAFAGEYRSEELGATYRIALENGGLVLYRPINEPIPMRGTAQDEFAAASLRLDFTRAPAAFERTGYHKPLVARPHIEMPHRDREEGSRAVVDRPNPCGIGPGLDNGTRSAYTWRCSWQGTVNGRRSSAKRRRTTRSGARRSPS